MNSTSSTPDSRALSASAGDGAPTFTPGPISESAAKEYFSRGQGLRLVGNRLFVALMLSLSINGMQGVSIAMLLPLHTVDQVVMHEAESGRLSPEYNAFANWSPDQNAVAYFLSEWADNVYDINGSVIDDRLASAGSLTIGDAKAQLRDLVKHENPKGRLRQYPDLRRTYKRLSVNFIRDDTALIRLQLTELTGPGATPTQKILAMTVTFSRIKPQTQDEVNRNPAGLYVSSFNAVEESGQ